MTRIIARFSWNSDISVPYTIRADLWIMMRPWESDKKDEMKKKRDRGRGERLEDANVVFRRRGGEGVVGGGHVTAWGRWRLPFTGRYLERSARTESTVPPTVPKHCQPLSRILTSRSKSWSIAIYRSTRENARLIRALGQRLETRRRLSITRWNRVSEYEFIER